MRKDPVAAASMFVLAGLACLLLALANGAAAKRLNPVRDPALIVYWSEFPKIPTIWSIRLDGSRRRRILHNRQNAKRPRLSPDRQWVAFDGTPPGEPPLSDFDIQLVRLDGTGLRTLTSSPEWDIDAQWSPDGTRLSFSRLPPAPIDARDSHIWIVNRDGTDLRLVVAGSTARWSPDGTKLVYTAPTGGSQGDLFIVNADGSDPHVLLSTADLEDAAGWSPDGTKILFTRTRKEGLRSLRHERRRHGGAPARAWPGREPVAGRIEDPLHVLLAAVGDECRRLPQAASVDGSRTRPELGIVDRALVSYWTPAPNV